MTRRLLPLALCILLVTAADAQLKSQEPTHVSVAQALVRPTTSLSGLLSWFNPDNFMMRHSFSFQYLSAGSYGMSLAAYTNSMFYRIADPLDLRFDISLQGSPFGSGQNADFSRLLLSRAELNYRPWENVHVRFLYRQVPYFDRGYYSPYYYPSSPALGDE